MKDIYTHNNNKLSNCKQEKENCYFTKETINGNCLTQIIQNNTMNLARM